MAEGGRSNTTPTHIGSSLRDARIRRKIDIAQVEADTKIRAKYLRAMENDEFDVLPGAAFVKSFLRTYAEYLGLDAHLLIEEYRANYEDRAAAEQPVFGEPPSYRPPRPRRIYRISPGVVLAAGLLAVVVFLYVLGLFSGGEDERSATDGGAPATKTAPRTGGGDRQTRPTREAQPPAAPGGAPKVIRLSIVASQNVWVCLVDAKGRSVVAGETLPAGTTKGPFKSKRFRATFGNGFLDLRLGGKRRSIPDTPNPVGYSITPTAVKPLAEGERPTCA